MTGVIASFPRKQFFNDAGEPIANGKVYTWQANAIGVTPLTTWADKGQVTANANPIVLDSDGKADIWLDPAKIYDFVVKDSTGLITYDTIEDISGSNSGGTVVSTEWNVTGLVATYVSATVFTVPGNQTSIFKVGSRVRVYEGGAVYKYGVIISSVFSSITSVTVASLTSPLSPSVLTADIGQLSPDNPSGLYASGNRVVLTGYSGADVTLLPGQYAEYVLSAATSLLLRIATGDNQEYEISLHNQNQSGSSIGTVATLQPNNTTTAAGAVKNHTIYATNTAYPTPTLSTNNLFNVSSANTLMQILSRVSTKTISKRIYSKWTTQDASLWYSGTVDSEWQDTVTAWSSLGTLTMQNAVTGLVRVKRLY